MQIYKGVFARRVDGDLQTYETVEPAKNKAEATRLFKLMAQKMDARFIELRTV